MALFFVVGAEADGDVGVPGVAGRAVALRCNLGPCRRMAGVVLMRGLSRIAWAFFVSGADADGDVGVPGVAGRAVALLYNLGPCRRMALQRSIGRKITISKIYLLLELLYANGHSWYLDRFG